MATVSQDLIWACTNQNNSYLLKRKTAGGVQFSRDPLNLTNKHSRKYEGFANDKAIGIQPHHPPTGKPGLTLTTKKPSVAASKPKRALNRTHISGKKGSRATYRGIVGQTAKRNYRPDLRREAVARAAAIKLSQRETRGSKERQRKLRGKKKRDAVEGAKI